VRITRPLSICAFLLIVSAGFVHTQNAGIPAVSDGHDLILTSTAFENDGVIPPEFTQSGPHPVSPPLEWTNVPPKTISFALILHDPDSVAAKDILHWMAFNIPGSARELPEDIRRAARLPDGTIQIRNRRGLVGYMAPGAPAGGPYHHYTFELFALSSRLDLGPDATRGEIFKAMAGHILGKATLVGRFHR
jgi:Raf kinase inhibitor-like YbhB/YbcL family protein